MGDHSVVHRGAGSGAVTVTVAGDAGPEVAGSAGDDVSEGDDVAEGDRGNGSGGWTPAEASNRRTASSASLSRPFRSRKRTDSGSPQRITTAYAAGTMPRAKAHRQPFAEAGTTR